ncbi:prolyl 4-hydroxylase subunit alpha-1-like [Daphnia pulicaria]|uniref:prolyl 4-hydroxylase subunit alpha-1-like n=1 Tax=Daphnia pulicaria TaxID=35523 RepID=UPI001EEA3FAA|nr:prolyl 4-hydroxylase subunit alpha-1-like [Daphnia pulicaria]
MQITTLIPALILLVTQSKTAFGDVFTAMADMEGLIATEFELVKHLDTYIQEEEKRMKQLRGILEEYESMYQEAIADVPKYLSNPVNAYLLVKRLTSDWKKVEGVISKNAGSAYIQNITQHRSLLRFPNEEDLNGAAVALMRLQDTYKLDTHALAEGKLLGGKKYSRHLTAGDCWELGRQSYNNGDHYHTVLWMAEALNKFEDESNKTVAREDILDYLAFSTYKQGNLKEALQMTNELLKIVPYHQRALGNKRHYEKLLRQLGVTERRGETGDEDNINMSEPFDTTKLKLTKPPGTTEHWDVYEQLCRGEKLMDPKLEGRLRCRYVTNNVPYFFIQPIKMEEALLKPRIVVYHDIISDEEIETIKRLAQPRFARATVQKKESGAREVSRYRIAKSAWLKHEEHDYVSDINFRVGDITGLDMATSEDLQVCNYGIGGHYEPHYDYARKGEVQQDFGWGGRIATLLFYMSDVEAGGATVFPKLNLSLWPQKGSAAFWYNLYPNGEGNEMTQHAGCPVLTGSKWVANYWIHERGQEFRRPCGPKSDFEM